MYNYRTEVIFMRIMAIDYGDARTGIAVSDILCSITGETWVISDWNPERIADIISAEAKKREVSTLVLGNPLNMDGSAGPRSEKCREFADMLRKKSGLEVKLWDERRTTVDAHRILSENGRHGKKRKNTVDAVAASLILEGYLNSLK